MRVATHPPYDIHIGPGVVRELPAWLLEHRPGVRYAIVTDTNVGKLHAGRLADLLGRAGLRAETVIFEAGEVHKTRASKEAVEDALLDRGLGRDAALLALGGGVVADLAGFVAATYLRGIPYVQIPTTLLAMVDASVGGKTGVDHPRGKNLIGAFHQPAAVFIDIDYLAGLPDRQFRSGLAEVVKAGVIRDAGLFDLLQERARDLVARDAELLTRAVARACEIKAEVVAADERESDLRKILNFGHTLGHAVETLSGYALTHGEAVSIGMAAESRLAVRAGLLSAEAADRIESLLEALQLPVRLPEGLRPERILEAARADKKSRDGRIHYALPDSLGRMGRGPHGHGIPLEDALAFESLKEIA